MSPTDSYAGERKARHGKRFKRGSFMQNYREVKGACDGEIMVRVEE